LRRYFAGYSLFGYFMIEEATRDELMCNAELRSQLGGQAVLFDRLLRAVSEEHTRECEAHRLPSQRGAAKRIERLLEGELLDTDDLNYDFDGHHTGLLASTVSARDRLSALAASLDARLLAVEREDGVLWAWLGSSRALDPAQLASALHAEPGPGLRLAIGEPGRGIAGWRMTHRQAQAALPIALRGAATATRYGDVAVLASLFKDDLAVSSLQELYLAPLETGRDGGAILCRTLRAYLAAGRNTTSAAAALGVMRHTVANRLRTIEGLIGRPLRDCTAEIEAALCLRDLSPSPE
jgi:PucR C-terminal helix-turn-helix domain/GGDEF-like domain